MFMIFLTGIFYNTVLYSDINCREKQCQSIALHCTRCTNQCIKHMYLGVICMFAKSCTEKIGFKVQRFVAVIAAEM